MTILCLNRYCSNMFQASSDVTSTIMNGHDAAAAYKDGQVPGVYHHGGLGHHINHPREKD